MPQFRSKPTIIDAEQFTDWDNPPRGVYQKTGGGGFYVIVEREQAVTAHVGDWIIEEPNCKGRHYPCNPEVFAAKYEPVP